MIKKILVMIVTAALPGAVFASEYHYKDILIGERASGMGGAYVAISDDPSGMYHNPAGIMFSQENYFSLSANAFSTETQKFQEIVPGQDYSYTSQSLLPAFFGFTQALGKHKFGFSVVVPSSQLIDQDDEITGLSVTDGKAHTFKRRLFQQDITYLAGPSFATEVMNNVTVGVTLYGFYRFMNAIDNQLVIFNPVPTGKYLELNTYARTSSFGLTPKLGVQYMPVPKLSLGVTASTTINAGGKGSVRVFESKTENGVPVNYGGSYEADKVLTENALAHEQPTNPSFSFGAAYFFSKRSMFTGQVDFHLPDNDFGYREVLNASLGGEFYVTEELAFRTGVYTNRSRTSPIDPTLANQAPNVNLLGGTLAVALCKPGSSLSVGAAYAGGKGQGQALGGQLDVQTVSQSQLSFYVTGSYQL
ncbi:MAG: hypothetical protein A2X94_04055 [Bdellovibrionales bacterium GWB1_55_8]|nr:MAG: hypothetical protein A2X94_04055 [Bdellovibrionales bacterium GWB1_55_8]